MLLVVSCLYCGFLVLLDIGLGGKDLFLWLLVVGGLVGYGLLLLGWGCYKKYSLLSCIRSSFCSLRFEACAMCVFVLLALVFGDYSGFGLCERG